MLELDRRRSFVVFRFSADFFVLQLEGQIRNSLDVVVLRFRWRSQKSTNRGTQQILIEIRRILKPCAQTHQETDNHRHQATDHAVPQIAYLAKEKNKSN